MKTYPDTTRPIISTRLMNIVPILTRLLALAAGATTLPFAAQTPPATHEPHGTATEPTLRGGPIPAIHAHVCGFHFYSGDLKRAVRVDHYCSHLNAEVLQCVIYDSDEKNARLIGIEYIISEALFKQLPAEEKKLWHSHRYEVTSGLLLAPDLAGAAEEKLMKELVSTYGKTWHLWQVDRGDTLPLGLPKLMMGFTADDQLDPAIVATRDRALGIDSARARSAHARIPTRPIVDGADGWQQGRVFQIGDDQLTPPQTAPKP